VFTHAHAHTQTHAHAHVHAHALTRLHTQIMRMEAEWREKALTLASRAEAFERKAGELGAEVDRLQPVLDAIKSGGRDEMADLDALLSSTLKIKELKAKCETLTMTLRNAEQGKSDAVKSRDKVAKRLEQLSEDVAILLLTIRSEVPFDEGLAEELLSNDRATFSGSLQDLKASLRRHLLDVGEKAAEQALEARGHYASSTGLNTFKKESIERLKKEMAVLEADRKRLTVEAQTARNEKEVEVQKLLETERVLGRVRDELAQVQTACREAEAEVKGLEQMRVTLMGQVAEAREMAR
jgi:chromosome segregation ATPase